MSEKPAYLTREGLAKLEAELEDLTTHGRKDIAERINAAKELGDISESGEYEDAKNQQAHLEGRIREIKNILSRAQIIEEDQNGHVIVGSAEARPREGKISNESPIGSALLGKRIRQKVSVETPSGLMKLTVVKVN
jgi:transcription elongation factor GreA